MVVQINQNTWRIDEKDVRFFLLEGKDKTLLVDTSEYRKLDGGLSCLSLRF